MGSSTSKRRKGHKNTKHLPKVGSPANKAWEHEQHQSEHFGTGMARVLIAVLIVVAIIGLLALTL